MPGYNLGDATGTIRINYDGSGVSQARTDVDALGASGQASAAKLEQTGGAMQKAGGLIVAGLGAAVVSAASFEKQLSAVEAVSGATTTEMEGLRQKALDIGKDTAFSASEGAQAIEELVKAGLTVPDVMNGAADATVALAAAGEVDLPFAASLASNAMNQFGLAAKELPGVADAIAGAANASAIDVTDFGNSLSQVGAVANLAGATFDDTATAIALLGNAGIKGSDAGTSLKSMLSNLQPDTEKTSKLFKELGIVTADGTNQFYDAEGSLKSLSEVSGVLQTSLEGMTDAQKQAALQTLFGSDGIRAAAILAEGGAAGFDKMAASIGKISAAEVAETRMDNLAGSIEAIKGSLETLLIQIGTPLLGGLKAVVDALTGFLDIVLSLDPAVLVAVTTFLSLVGVSLLVAGTVLKLIAVFKAGGAAVALLTSPITLIIVAIAALIAAFVYFYKTNETFREGVQKVAAAVKDFLITAFQAALPYIKQVGEFLQNAFQTALPYVMSFLAAVGQFVGYFIANVLPVILQVAGAIGGFLLDALRTIIPIILNLAGTVISGLVDAFQAILPHVLAMIPAIQDFLGSVIELVQAILTRLQPAFDVIGPAITFVIDVLKILFEVFTGTLLPLLAKVAGVFLSVFGGTIVNVLTTALDVIRNVFGIITGIIKVFTGILTGDFGKAWEGVKQIFSSAAGVILSVVSGLGKQIGIILDGIADLMVAGVKAIPGLLEGLGKFFLAAGKFIITEFVNGIKNAAGLISGIAGNIYDFLKGLINGAINQINRALEFNISVAGVSVGINPPDIPALAKGGVVSSATLALVGEAGSEAVTPLAWLERQLNRAYDMGQTRPETADAAFSGSVSAESDASVLAALAEALGGWSMLAEKIDEQTERLSGDLAATGNTALTLRRQGAI